MLNILWISNSVHTKYIIWSFQSCSQLYKVDNYQTSIEHVEHDLWKHENVNMSSKILPCSKLYQKTHGLLWFSNNLTLMEMVLDKRYIMFCYLRCNVIKFNGLSKLLNIFLGPSVVVIMQPWVQTLKQF